LGLSFGEVTFNFEHAGNLYQSSDSPAAAPDGTREAMLKDVAYILERLSREKMPMAQKAKSFYRRHFIEGIPRFMSNPDKVLFPCKAARNSFFLDPYGTVYPCIIWDTSLGTYRDGIKAIGRSDRVKDIRQAIKDSKCPVCWNACELIPSLLTSWSLVGCVGKSLLGK
jgi:MoaA/NifB/PqqE/SkfB family radical SAM enzyme